MAVINKKRQFSGGEENVMFGMSKKRRFSPSEERGIDELELLNKIGQGAYGVVYRAQHKKTGEVVAVKKVKSDEDAEAKILAGLKRHRSIVELMWSGGGYLVMEYAENDMRSLLETMRQPLSQSEVKCLMQQLLQGVDHLHRNQVLHRDLKTSNLLLNNRGELKICDFGLACRFNNNNMIRHTETVVTLWYRAPELLLGAKEYSTAVDMWSVGCIMAEFLLRRPLFDGTVETDQLHKIVKNDRNLLRQRFPAVSFTGSTPVLSNAGFDLLSRLLTYDPRKRMSAEEALDHSWFREVPLPKSRDFMPTFPPNFAAQMRTQSATGSGLFGL
ncbi:cyclin-dependent kinase G-2-like [Salvia miltiorrhiza]|uniref:cyclin-dependent kinase G-2-like n=1 Tax=Salvia miltiorrhiza TaxID=226208 RepID=UPI0025ACB3CF|nr:cyclin-dependent kinase G-2-like [Salvia miltiorrhiza]